MEEENQGSSSDNQVVYSWQALEFSRPSAKAPRWYLIAGIVGLILVAYTIYTQQWLRLVVVVVLGFVVWLVSKMQPREFEHQITTEGLIVGGKSYPFSKFRAYAIVQSGEGDRLMLLPKQALGQGIALQLGGADVERIRTIMQKVLPEETREEDVVDRMNRWLNL